MLRAFTLIEVMVAVVIISVVIMALIELLANNSHNFSTLDKKAQTNQYLSFFHSPSRYGFTDKQTTLYDLLKDFDLESELKEDLKAIKVNLIYQEIDSIDMSDYNPDEGEETEETQEDKEEQANSTMAFEIGKTVLKIDDASVSMLRIKEK